jgi:hypothetical protein
MTLAEALARAAQLPPEKQAEIADFVEFLLDRASAETANDFGSRGAAAGDSLKDDPFIGLWADRSEMADSAAYIRQLRKNEWERRRN